MNRTASRLLRRIRSGFPVFRKVIADTTGNATIEFAITFTILGAPLMLGTAGAAFLVYDSIEVSSAAHAGASYGMINSTLAQDTAGIQSAAQAEAPDLGPKLSVTPTSYYACSGAIDGTRYSTTTAAAAVCPLKATNHYLQFVQVNTSASIKSPIAVPGLSGAWTLVGSSVMEVQE